jgi:hypothetical protein
MQFYLNGYTPGDPFIEDPHPVVAERPGGLPEDVDVLIIGSGPAGLVLAAQMAEFPEIRTAVIERKDGPLEVGQADGVACRTVEMFEAFGLAGRLVNEAYWVNEVPSGAPTRKTGARSSVPAHPGHRRGLGVPARDRQPGADARLPSGSHGAVCQPAGAALWSPRCRSADVGDVSLQGFLHGRLGHVVG